MIVIKPIISQIKHNALYDFLDSEESERSRILAFLENSLGQEDFCLFFVFFQLTF